MYNSSWISLANFTLKFFVLWHVATDNFVPCMQINEAVLDLIRSENVNVRRVSEHTSNHVWERVRPHLHYHKRLLRGHSLHFITHAGNDISRRTGNHTYLPLIYGLKDWNKSPPRVSLPSSPYPQSPLIPLNQWKCGRLIACSIACSVFQISQTASIMLMTRRMRTRAIEIVQRPAASEKHPQTFMDGLMYIVWSLQIVLRMNTIMRNMMFLSLNLWTFETLATSRASCYCDDIHRATYNKLHWICCPIMI